MRHWRRRADAKRSDALSPSEVVLDAVCFCWLSSGRAFGLDDFTPKPLVSAKPNLPGKKTIKTMSGAVWQRQQFYLLYNTKSSKNTGDHSPLGRIPKREPV